VDVLCGDGICGPDRRIYWELYCGLAEMSLNRILSTVEAALVYDIERLGSFAD
jgi:hypothetical protein